MLVALALVSVFGIGGAKLKGKYNDTAKLYTAIDKYNNSIQSDFGPRWTRRLTLIKQVGYLENAPTEALQDARVALEVWNNTAADPPPSTTPTAICITQWMRCTRRSIIKWTPAAAGHQQPVQRLCLGPGHH